MLLILIFQTYAHDGQVPDSAATATAMLCGVKANIATMGFNHYVQYNDCSNITGNDVDSVMRLSQLAGKDNVNHLIIAGSLLITAIIAQENALRYYISGY